MTYRPSRLRARPSPVRGAPSAQPTTEPPQPRTQDAPPPVARRPEIGMVSGDAVITIFKRFLYGAALVLALLSWLGTFYGLLGTPAPLDTFAAMKQLPVDIRNHWQLLIVAFLIQGVLTLTQYAARQIAQYDRRWWLLYLVSLGVSVYYNFQAYYAPLTAHLVPLAVVPLILFGDIAPELITVRQHTKAKG